MESTQEQSNKNDFLIHYKKINIMGNEGVGKSSLITFFENYDNHSFVIKPQNLSRSQSDIGNDNNINLVEQIKKITVEYSGLINLYLNIYETNLDQIDIIKMNLDVLLSNTECVIFIYDKNNLDSLDNIKKLIPIIRGKIDRKEILNIPIFLLKNKMDEESDEQNDSEIEQIKDLVIFEKISLFNRNKFQDFIYDFYGQCYTHSKIDKKEFVNNIKLNDPLRQAFNDLKGKNLPNLKLLLAGNQNVGKTSFINYFNGKKIDKIIYTIGSDEYDIFAEVDDKIVNIRIRDTAGQEIYRSNTKNYYAKSQGVLLFFDVTNKKSFDEINEWLKGINNNNEDAIIYLIGNKIDLYEKREVPKQDAKDFAEKNNMTYYECSCLNGIGVYEIVNEIIYKIVLKTDLDDLNASVNSINLNKNRNIGNNNASNIKNKESNFQRNPDNSCNCCH